MRSFWVWQFLHAMTNTPRLFMWHKHLLCHDRACLLLFFTDKVQWTNMTAPWGVHVWSKKALLLYKYWQNHIKLLSATFLYLCRPACMWSPLTPASHYLLLRSSVIYWAQNMSVLLSMSSSYVDISLFGLKWVSNLSRCLSSDAVVQPCRIVCLSWHQWFWCWYIIIPTSATKGWCTVHIMWFLLLPL